MLVMVKSKKNKSKFVLNKICFRMFFDANVVVKILLSKYISKFFWKRILFELILLKQPQKQESSSIMVLQFLLLFLDPSRDDFEQNLDPFRQEIFPVVTKWHCLKQLKATVEYVWMKKGFTNRFSLVHYFNSSRCHKH